MDARKYVRLEGQTSAPSFRPERYRTMALSDSTYEPSSLAKILGYLINTLLTSFACALFGAISFSIGVLFDVMNTLNVNSKGSTVVQGALGGFLISPLVLIASLIHYHHSRRHADPPVDDTDLWVYHKRVFLSCCHLFYMLLAGCLAGGVGYAGFVGSARVLDAVGFRCAGGVVFTVVVLIILALRYTSCPLCERCTHTKRRCDCSGCSYNCCDCSCCDCSGCDCSGCDCNGCTV